MQPALTHWIDYIEGQIGFVLPSTQQQWLVNAIVAVAHKAQMSTDELYRNLGDDTLRQQLIDAVLIPESRFFRSQDTFEFIGQQYEQYITKNSVNCGKISEQALPSFLAISVGCSTGQEVWSLAMVLEDIAQKHSVPSNYELVGIDASSCSLAIAKAACYGERALNEIPPSHHRFIEPFDKGWQVKTALTKKASFFLCNVFAKESSVLLSSYANKADIVLCQNMLIYFRQFDQRDILARLETLLKPQGYLLLGAGEGLFWRTNAMQRIVGNYVNLWQKNIST